MRLPHNRRSYAPEDVEGFSANFATANSALAAANLVHLGDAHLVARVLRYPRHARL
jgi:hypothetical protein